MTAKYWIKLYHEILDDPKMGMMPDRLWRRTIELFLFAGESGDDGQLPDVLEMAWRLRVDPQAFQNDIEDLQHAGIVYPNGKGYVVKNFAKRQAAMPKAEYMRRKREGDRKQQYYQPVTESVTETVTISNTEPEEDTDKSRVEEGQPLPLHPVAILSKASGLSTFPPTQLERIEQVRSLQEDYGDKKTVEVMKMACDQWRQTKGKSGRPYRVTNLGWIDWAQDFLIAGSPLDKDPADMTKEERDAWFAREMEKLDA